MTTIPFREAPETPGKVWQQSMRPMMVNDSLTLFDLRCNTIRQELAGAMFFPALWRLFDHLRPSYPELSP